MARLTAAERERMPKGEFALPGNIKTGKRGGRKTRGAYPINDRRHAANAKSRVAQFGTPAEKAKVDAAVARKYPDMGKE